MAPALLARNALPAASRALLRVPRAAAPVRARFNSSDAPVDLNAVAAKARVVKTLPDFSMANKVRLWPPFPPSRRSRSHSPSTSSPLLTSPILSPTGRRCHGCRTRSR